MRNDSNILARILAAVFFCLPFFASPQAVLTDSAKSDTTYLFRFHAPDFLSDTHQAFQLFDFHNAHRYEKQSASMPFLGIGNPGHAVYSPVFSAAQLKSDVNKTLFPAFFPYYRLPQNILYHRNQPPVTDIQYVTGAKQEEFFNLLHARNFGSNLNASIHLNRQVSNGFYNHLHTLGAHFDINANYNTTNERYTFIAHYYYNKKSLEENGGYVDFNAVENPETAQSSRLDLANNVLREEGLAVGQTLGIGSLGKRDSVAVIPLFRLAWDFKYSGGYRFYSDEGAPENNGNLDTSVYDLFIFDSTLTRDSIVYTCLSNQGGIFIYPLNTTLGVYFRHEVVGYDQNHLMDTNYFNQYAGVSFRTSERRKYGLKFNAEYGTDGFEKGNSRNELRLEKRLRDSTDIVYGHIGLTDARQVPQFYQNRYLSNNANWINAFAAMEYQYVDALIGAMGYNLGVESGTIKNYFYFNDQSRPDQFSGSIQYISLGFNKVLHWKWFHLDNGFRYQQFSRNDLIPLPNYLIRESFYFQSYIFNKVLQYQIGCDVFFYPAHYGYAYTPYLGQFHLQQGQKTGDYPYVDVFLNARLKRAFFFLKISHFNKGMSGNDYFQVPDYPVPPRSFKFGVRWVLFD